MIQSIGSVAKVIATIRSFPTSSFLILLDHCLGHKIETPACPLGALKFEIGSLVSWHQVKFARDGINFDIVCF